MSDYAATWLGGMIGGVAGFAGARPVVFALGRDFILFPDVWVWIGVVVLGMTMIGSGLGTWLCLRMCRYDRPVLTAVFVPILSVVLAGAFLALGAVLLPFVHGEVRELAFWTGGMAATFGGAVLARLLATGGRVGVRVPNRR